MDLKYILPEIIFFIFVMIGLTLDLFIEDSGSNKRLTNFIYPGGAALAILFGSTTLGIDQSCFWGAFKIDLLSQSIKILILSSAILVMLLSIDYFKTYLVNKGEYFALIAFSVIGMMFMVSANDFISFFLSLQLTSIPLYILAGIDKEDPKSNEAAYKYLMLGMLASVVMLYGMSIIYGFTGSIHYNDISTKLTNIDITQQPILLLAMFFLFSGFAFKVAAVPFHFWVPDTYEGAPTPISLFLATAPKAAGFIALIRFVITAFSPLQYHWRPLFIILSILSMFIGNIVALFQENIKRMLGFSSVAHVGYILMAFVVADQPAYSAVIFYVMIYCIINIGAFAVVAAVAHGDYSLEGFIGLYKKSPFMSSAMALFLISMIGIPPTPGFWGKLSLFGAAIHKDMAWLAIIGIINSAISVYYYVNVLKYIYTAPEEINTKAENPAVKVNNESLQVPTLMKFVVAIALIMTLIFSIYPQPFMEIATKATSNILKKEEVITNGGGITNGKVITNQGNK